MMEYGAGLLMGIMAGHVMTRYWEILKVEMTLRRVRHLDPVVLRRTEMDRLWMEGK